MIWLKDKNILTKGEFVSLDEESVKKAHNELKKLESSYLIDSKIIFSNKRVSDYSENGILTKYYETDISASQYLVKQYKSKYPTCVNILENLNNNYEVDLREMIDVYSNSFSVLSRVSKYEDTSLKRFLTEKINPDYYFFIYRLLEIMRIKKISEHDISKIEKIKELSKEETLDTNCDYYLDRVIVAESNSKILTLAQKLRR